MAKINYKMLALTLGLIAFSFLFVWYIFAWTEPSAVPPGGNVPAPLNVGPDGQIKEGGLWLAHNSGVTTGLIVEYGNVGIGTTGPNYSLHVVNPASTDNKMFFDSAKGAFRAGYAADAWNDANIGDGSTAFGVGTIASGPESVAIGLDTIADGYASLAMGEFSEALGDQAIAMGRLAIASGQYVPVAIGENITASGARSAIAIGRKITASGTFSMVLGHGTEMPSTRIVNNIDNSLMVGFNSDISTLFVGPSSGVGTTGNVGIGTTSPSGKFEVNPDGIADNGDEFAVDNNGHVAIGATAAASKLLVITSQFRVADFESSSPSGTFIGMRTNRPGARLWQFINYGDANPNLLGKFSINDATDAADRLVIDNSGYVGIGTTNPGKKLDVVGGEIRSDAGLCITGATPECISDWPAGGAGFWAASGVDDIYNTNTGNVGIGITNPGNTLTILSPDMGGGSNGVTLNVNTTNWDDAFYRFGHNGFAFNRGLYYDSSAGRVSIWVDQERLSVLSNGNVGIGTTSPGAKLEVSSGKIRVRGGELNAAYVDISGEGKALGAGWYGKIQVRDDNPSSGAAHTLSLNPHGGYVGIGTTDPTSNLHVNGLPEYADNADANANGLTAGAFYRTGDVLKVVHH